MTLKAMVYYIQEGNWQLKCRYCGTTNPEHIMVHKDLGGYLQTCKICKETYHAQLQSAFIEHQFRKD